MSQRVGYIGHGSAEPDDAYTRAINQTSFFEIVNRTFIRGHLPSRFLWSMPVFHILSRIRGRPHLQNDDLLCSERLRRECAAPWTIDPKLILLETRASG